ncbi:PIG-L deacetylase family protein [Natronoflexus pectinivorans]|uniref:GlcNAc-PI de-N-acetylase n=1 Tax=Natronoflexus pectinivorans TaxID=682526 RepID=A0A4R2GGT0_9BACT|nr:PIG-L family deacetylase [Natronoflexus pectinivorans]TCO07268.1 hypothetical protein EV194_10986 [Natronoflexus pectinivorans]
MSISISPISVVVIVAHPDDETLWSGGTILSRPTYEWFIISLCRGSDPDRAPKFLKAITTLKATGIMGNLDDGIEQIPLRRIDVEKEILALLPYTHFDIIISHNPTGEYTRHLRHEEIGEAVIYLWYKNKISANQLWVYAYNDGNKGWLPKSVEKATISHTIPKKIWEKKLQIITEIYGFPANSWEAQTTPKTEAFWQFTNPATALKWLNSIK